MRICEHLNDSHADEAMSVGHLLRSVKLVHVDFSDFFFWWKNSSMLHTQRNWKENERKPRNKNLRFFEVGGLGVSKILSTAGSEFFLRSILTEYVVLFL